jgi:transcriptional regulator with XRE-family HTH domain
MIVNYYHSFATYRFSRLLEAPFHVTIKMKVIFRRPKMSFGKKLSLLRKEFNLTQSDLAKQIGVSRGTIGMYEIDKRDPDTCTLKKISCIFNISIDYLLDTADDPSQIQLSKHYLTKEISHEYLILAKEIQDKQICPGDIKKFIDILQRNK